MIPTHIKRRQLYSQRRLVGGKMRTIYHKVTGSGMQPVNYMKKSGRTIYRIKSGAGFFTDALRALGHGSVDFLANRFGSGLKVSESSRDSILSALSSRQSSAGRRPARPAGASARR